MTNSHSDAEDDGKVVTLRPRPPHLILKAPAFHGAKPRGRVKLATNPNAGPSPKKLAEAIATAQVGGTFWERQPVLTPFHTLIRVRSPRLVRQAAALAHLSAEALVWYPGQYAAKGIGEISNRISGLTEAPITWLGGRADPWFMIAQATEILADPDDEIALLAAAAGKSVLSLNDGGRIVRELAITSLASKVAAYDYVNPFTGQSIDAFKYIEILAEWRTQIDENRRIAMAVGISRWKHQAIKCFLWSTEPARIKIAADLNQATPNKAVAIWPSRVAPDFADQANKANIPLVQLEDGFIRSVGLGTHLHPPRSIVVDPEGIYYDPRKSSKLERLLKETNFDERLLSRAARLIDYLKRQNITKYASGKRQPLDLPPTGRRVLVPGQVENDLSVHYGGAGILNNEELLQRVRTAEPNAFIIYKPHPDVVAGLRSGHIPEKDARRYADIVLPQVDMATLLNEVDAVHVLTSLTGFEALLRGREVITHGQPFYAGWGLTRDLAPAIVRRQRQLTIVQLVAAALILYPRYLDPVTNLPCPPEVLIKRHGSQHGKSSSSLLTRMRKVQGGFAVLTRTLTELMA